MNKTKTLGTIVAVMLAAACGGAEPAAPPPATPTGAMTPSMPPAVTTPPAPVETPVTAPAPKVATPQETTMALIDGWNAHDADKVAAVYSENAVLRIAPLPDVTGRNAIKASAADAFKTFPDFKVVATRVTMKGNVAAVEWVITGTQTGDSDAMKLKATGRKMGLRGADMVTFDDVGLIKEAHRYYDMPTQMAQLDAKAKAGTFRPVEALPTAMPVIASVKGTPDEQKNLDAANVLYKAIDDHKVDGVLAVTTTDSWMDDFSNPATLKNQKAMKGFLESVIKAIPDVTQDRITQIAAGDLVITEGYLHGTMKGNMGPMKATNKPIGMHFIDVMQMKDGKMAKGWSYGNSMEMAPPPAK